MQIDPNEALNEIMGTFSGRGRDRTRQSRNYQSPDPEYEDLRITGVKMRHCNTLESWQRDIVRSITGNNDQYIIARPGGGKTLPIICYWADQMLGLNTSQRIVNVRQRRPRTNLTRDERIRQVEGELNRAELTRELQQLFRTDQRDTPKLLMMVPVIALAQQTGAEFRRDLASVMMQYYNSNIPEVLNFLGGRNGISPDIQRVYAERARLRDEFMRVTDPEREPDPRRARPLREALQSLNKVLVEQVVRFIVQTVTNRVYIRTGGGERSHTPIEEASIFVTIYESAPQLFKSVTIRNLGLVVIDEAHLAQESGVEIEDQSRSYQIAGAIYKVLGKIRRERNCRLVLLTGTINPASASALTNYLNDNFGRNFPNRPVVAPATAANRSMLAVVRNESIRSDEGIVKSITRSVYQNDWGQLYVLFSAAKIAGIVNDCIKRIGIRNVENTSPQGYSPTNNFSGLGRERQGTGSTRLNDLDLLSIPDDMKAYVANITNPLLRQSVLRGIGFIHRKVPGDQFSNERELRMNDRDKIIVAKLFKDRKINVLLATDAVGIGVNIDVKELYIPTLQKFNPTVKNHAELSLRDLAQILNRAGRGATPIASIQTPQENIETVNNALMAGPDDFPEVGAHKRYRHAPSDARTSVRRSSQETLHNLLQRVRHPIRSGHRTPFRR